MPDKVAGNFGKLPQLQGGSRLNVDWVHHYFGAAPEPTYPIDVSQNITLWRLLGNGPDPNCHVGPTPSTGYGNCVPCAKQHDRMLAIVSGRLPDIDLPTADVTVTEYLDYTNSVDSGVVIAQFLLWLYQNKKIAAFAPVALDQIDAEMQRFNRGIILGTELTNNNMSQFNNDQPWTASQSDPPNPDNGHGVLKDKAYEGGNGVIVTWGFNHQVDASWFQLCADEAWIILTNEDKEVLSPSGWQTLVSDLDALPNAHSIAA